MMKLEEPRFVAFQCEGCGATYSEDEFASLDTAPITLAEGVMGDTAVCRTCGQQFNFGDPWRLMDEVPGPKGSLKVSTTFMGGIFRHESGLAGLVAFVTQVLDPSGEVLEDLIMYSSTREVAATVHRNVRNLISALIEARAEEEAPS